MRWGQWAADPDGGRAQATAGAERSGGCRVMVCHPARWQFLCGDGGQTRDGASGALCGQWLGVIWWITRLKGGTERLWRGECSQPVTQSLAGQLSSVSWHP